MASSIHIGKVSSGSFLHNDRTQKVSYLIDDSSLNECSRSSSYCLAEYQSLKLKASENYTKLTNQKMQKSTIFLKEAIVNLQEHHTLKDLEPIKERLESYGFKVMQMSIHRDEGFVNKENKKEKNYHAHITMFNLDLESGKSVKFGKDYRTELSKLQTFTANALKMERGKVSVQEHADELKVSVSKASKRLDTHDYKKAMKIKEEAQQQLTISQKQGLLKDITIVKSGYDFREMQAKITALETLSAEQKKELHKLNSETKNTPELESKNIKIQELELQIQNLTATAAVAGKEIKALKNAVVPALSPEQFEAVKQLEPLQSYIKAGEFVKENILGFRNQAVNASKTVQEQKTTIDTQKSEIVNLRADMSVLSGSLLNSQGQVQTIEKHIEAQIEPTFAPQKSLKDRFYGFIKELKETIKSQASEILNLKDQVQSLLKQNQEYKELVAVQVQEIANPKQNPKTLSYKDKDFIFAKINDIKWKLYQGNKDDSYTKDDMRQELKKDVYEKFNISTKIQPQELYDICQSKVLTKEDLQKANQSTKSQSSGYDLSR